MRTITLTEGEFAGWSVWPDEPFEFETVGPFHFRIDEKGPVSAFRAQRKHMNGAGVMHGGCLMAFADFALFAIAHDGLQNSYGLTVAFTSEFLDGPREGEWVEARGELLREGGSLVFVRGIVTSDGRPCLNFSGTIKKVRKPAQ